MPYGCYRPTTGGIYAHRVTIDREDASPPYQQVAAILRQQIISGELPPRRRLPSISTLVQEYGIARTTAVKALHVLVDEGLAEVVPGWGTYVAGQQ